MKNKCNKCGNDKHVHFRESMKYICDDCIKKEVIKENVELGVFVNIADEKTKKCMKCNQNNPIEYEEIGLGKYCQKCLDEEIEIWNKEAGSYNGK